MPPGEMVGALLAGLGCFMGLLAGWLNLSDARHCPPNKRALRIASGLVALYSGALYGLIAFGITLPMPMLLRPAHVTLLAILAALVIVEW